MEKSDKCQYFSIEKTAMAKNQTFYIGVLTKWLSNIIPTPKFDEQNYGKLWNGFSSTFKRLDILNAIADKKISIVHKLVTFSNLI